MARKTRGTGAPGAGSGLGPTAGEPTPAVCGYHARRVLPQLAPGSIFAQDYRILQLLAEGGMGAVYVAEQLSTGKRRALKTMLPQLVSDARARERFHQEAKIGARIESEHVVEVVGAGIDGAIPWLAMELLDGTDLAGVIRTRGALPPAEAAEILAQLGDGLGAAHAGGIVHRDLKPENLFIATSRRRGVPFTLKILDFGIAKITEEGRSGASSTASIGSPMWMAPEQTESRGRLSPATDVWALGLIAFHMLTGRVYWRSANDPDLRLAVLITEVLTSPLAPASARAAELRAAVLPPGFDAWFARCVDRQPERRWPDARAAIAALPPALATDRPAVPVTAVSVRPVPATVPMVAAAAPVPVAPTTPYAVSGAPSRSGLGLLAAAMFVLLGGAGLLTFGGLHLWQQLRGRGAVAPVTPVTPVVPVVPAPVAQPDAGAPALARVRRPEPRRAEDPTARPGGTGSPAAEVAPGTETDTEGAETAAETDPGPGRGPHERPDHGAFAWPDGSTLRWRASWDPGPGWRWQLDIRLRRQGSALDGTIRWLLARAPADSELADRVGDHTDESVDGEVDDASGRLTLQGRRVSDPELSRPDGYVFRLGPNGTLVGRADSDRSRPITARLVP